MTSIQDDSPIECGEEAAKHFGFAPGYRNLNHGSYGSSPLPIRHLHQHFRDLSELRPDAFVRYSYRPELLARSRRALEGFVRAEPDTCVFAPNTSFGLDIVLRNLVFERGRDAVICFSTVYEAVANTLEYLRERDGVVVRKVEYKLPESDGRICEAFERGIEVCRAEGLRVKVGVFDTVNSLPGVRMPFEELIGICRREGVLSCVDAAHSVGMFGVDLEGLDPDFWVANLHKWLYVPRGCAMLYVPKRNQGLIRTTLPTGFHFVPEARKGEMDMVKNFSDLGTLDNSPIACVPEVIAWRRRVAWGGKRGDEAIEGYLLDLARRGGELVAEMLGTAVLENAEGTLGRCGLTNVKIPLSLKEIAKGDTSMEFEVLTWMRKAMIVEYETAVYVFIYEGELWVRLSAQIYLTISDFQHAGQKLRELCERVKAGEWASKAE